MNVSLNLYPSKEIVSFFQQNFSRSLTDQNKKIFVVATIALGLLAAYYLIRYYSKMNASVMQSDEIKLPHDKIEAEEAQPVAKIKKEIDAAKEILDNPQKITKAEDAQPEIKIKKEKDAANEILDIPLEKTETEDALPKTKIEKEEDAAKESLDDPQENLAQEAFEIFNRNKKLKFYINRGYSRSYQDLIPNDMKEEDILSINKNFKDHCLANVSPQTNPSHKYFFYNSNRETRYINEDVLDRFETIAEAKFPDFGFFKRGGIIDKETNIQLIPIKKNGPQSFHFEDNLSLQMKLRAWVAKLDDKE